MSDGQASPDGASTPESGTESPNPQHGQQSASKKSSKTSKPRLTATQKSFNHKDAENKRRTAIRDRFTELSQMVPGALGQERSEQVMLAKTSDYLKELLTEQRRLEQVADERGVSIGAEDRLRDDDFGGSDWKQPNMEAYEADKAKKMAKDGSKDGSKLDDDDDD